mmetsp:Transcript_32594/g.38991  ORF Transcript_32594/g.38991 Transcript_32594/m.38991 type:complete len:96 (+) Transcript_32594:72-359(+)
MLAFCHGHVNNNPNANKMRYKCTTNKILNPCNCAIPPHHMLRLSQLNWNQTLTKRVLHFPSNQCCIPPNSVSTISSASVNVTSSKSNFAAHAACT